MKVCAAVAVMLAAFRAEAADLPVAASWEILYQSVGAGGAPNLLVYAGPFARKPRARAIADCEKLMTTKCIALEQRNPGDTR